MKGNAIMAMLAVIVTGVVSYLAFGRNIQNANVQGIVMMAVSLVVGITGYLVYKKLRK